LSENKEENIEEEAEKNLSCLVLRKPLVYLTKVRDVEADKEE